MRLTLATSAREMACQLEVLIAQLVVEDMRSIADRTSSTIFSMPVTRLGAQNEANVDCSTH
jgi:hypothetical protein